MADKTSQEEGRDSPQEHSSTSRPRMGRRDSVLGRLLIPIITIVLLSATFFAYYFFYVKERSEYLTNRNFRALAILGNQLSDTIGNYGGILKDFGNEVKRRDTLPKKLSPADQTRYLRFLAPALQCFERYPVSAKALQPLELKFWNGEWTLNFNAVAESVVFHGCQGVKELADPFTAALPFDDVLIATNDGTVIYQKTTTGLQFTTLESLFPAELAKTAYDSKEQQPDTLERRPGQTGSLKAAKTKTGGQVIGAQDPGSAGHQAVGLFQLERSPTVSPLNEREVVVGGTRYRVFMQPVLLNLFAQKEQVENYPREWILCGLVRSSEFQWQSLAISYGTMIYIGAALLLVGLSIPFLKVLFINRREHFRIREVFQTVSFAVLVTAVVTFVWLQVFYFGPNRHDDTDSQLASLAQSISQNVHIEISLMFEQLRSLCGETSLQEDLMRSSFANRISVTNVLAERLHGQAIYPYFESAFWTREQAVSESEKKQNDRTQEWQVVKWSVREFGTPMIAVDEIPFSRQVRNKEFFLLHEAHAFRIDSVQSPNKDEYLAVLGMPTYECLPAKLPESGKDALPVEISRGSSFIVTRMLSLIDPVLPIGYGFALVDNRGRVLFHSDHTRNNRENFLEETDNNRELAAAIYGRAHPNTFTLKYLGRDFRATVTSVQGVTRAPWALIVFRDLCHVQTLNLETMVMASSAYGSVLLLPLLGLGIWYLWSQPRYIPCLLWPKKRYLPFYIMQSTVCLILGTVFVLHWSQPGTEELLSAIVMTAYATVVFGVWGGLLLQHRPRRRVRLGNGVAAIVLGATCVGFSKLFDWNILPIGLCVAFLAFAWLVVWVRPRRQVVRWRALYQYWYLTTIVLTLILTAVFPAFGLFYVALNVEYRLQAKQGQLYLSEEFQAREHRLAFDFEQEHHRPGADVTANMRTRRRDTMLDNYSGSYYRTSIYAESHHAGNALNLGSMGDLPNREHYHEWFLDRIYALHHPYNDVAGQMLGVVRNRKPPRLSEPPPLLDPYPEWIWDTERQLLVLRRHGFLSLKEVGRDGGKDRKDPPTDLVLCSVLTSRRSRAELLDCFEILSLVLLIIVPLMRAVGRKMFLFHIRRPLSGQAAGKHRLILLDSWDEWKAPPGTIDLRSAWIGPSKATPAYTQIEELFAALPPQKVVLSHFGVNFEDRESCIWTLKLLEQLALETHREVDLVSEVDLFYYISGSLVQQDVTAEGVPDWPSLSRWAAALVNFEKVDLRSPVAPPKTPLTPALRTFVKEECMVKPELVRIFTQVINRLDGVEALTEEQLVQELLDRADVFYHSLWAACTKDEWFVLMQLAKDGMVNPKNERPIRQLLRRGLIRRDPFRMMNESFRLFVLNACPHDVVQEWEQDARRSGWGRVKGGFMMALIMIVGFLLATQQDLWQSSLTIVTATLGTVGTIFKVITAIQGRNLSDK
jgi:hypothetical protein